MWGANCLKRAIGIENAGVATVAILTAFLDDTLGSKTGLASPRASLCGLYPLGPVLPAALVRHPAARLRHLPQGGAVQLACDGECGDPLEVAARGSSVKSDIIRPSEGLGMMIQLARKTFLHGSPRPATGQPGFLLDDLSPLGPSGVFITREDVDQLSCLNGPAGWRPVLVSPHGLEFNLRESLRVLSGLITGS